MIRFMYRVSLPELVEIEDLTCVDEPVAAKENSNTGNAMESLDRQCVARAAVSWPDARGIDGPERAKRGHHETGDKTDKRPAKRNKQLLKKPVRTTSIVESI